MSHMVIVFKNVFVVGVYSDGPLRFVTKTLFNDTFDEDH